MQLLTKRSFCWQVRWSQRDSGIFSGRECSNNLSSLSLSKKNTWAAFRWSSTKEIPKLGNEIDFLLSCGQFHFLRSALKVPKKRRQLQAYLLCAASLTLDHDTIFEQALHVPRFPRLKRLKLSKYSSWISKKYLLIDLSFCFLLKLKFLDKKTIMILLFCEINTVRYLEKKFVHRRMQAPEYAHESAWIFRRMQAPEKFPHTTRKYNHTIINVSMKLCWRCHFSNAAEFRVLENKPRERKVCNEASKTHSFFNEIISASRLLQLCDFLQTKEKKNWTVDFFHGWWWWKKSQVVYSKIM